MRILRLELLQLSKVSARLRRQLLPTRTNANIDAAIAEHDGARVVDESKGVENVSQLVRRQLGDRATLRLHAPGREVADNAHRRGGSHPPARRRGGRGRPSPPRGSGGLWA